jgi:deoxyribose-phosphate aldolase
VCVWPAFVAQAVELLRGSGVKVATVVNFPDGGAVVAPVLDETVRALADGADEIDLVLPYRALLAGQSAIARTMVEAVRAAVVPPAKLKVILETGSYPSAHDIRRAADLAIDAGADFVKTSTGKTEHSATVEAVRVLLEAIRDAGRPVGVKPSGGIRTVVDAEAYLSLADEVMGAGWVTPATFRFGASGLLDGVDSLLDAAAEGAG